MATLHVIENFDAVACVWLSKCIKSNLQIRETIWQTKVD